MVKAVDIQAVLATKEVLRSRRPESPVDDEEKYFATLADFRDGGIFAGSFEGDSPWERHPQGDELVQVLAGRTRLTILTDAGPQELEMTAGMLTVVPQGCWHRFSAPEGVTVLTATPQPTEHTAAEHPEQTA